MLILAGVQEHTNLVESICSCCGSMRLTDSRWQVSWCVGLSLRTEPCAPRPRPGVHYFFIFGVNMDEQSRIAPLNQFALRIRRMSSLAGVPGRGLEPAPRTLSPRDRVIETSASDRTPARRGLGSKDTRVHAHVDVCVDRAPMWVRSEQRPRTVTVGGWGLGRGRRGMRFLI